MPAGLNVEGIFAYAAGLHLLGFRNGAHRGKELHEVMLALDVDIMV